MAGGCYIGNSGLIDRVGASQALAADGPTEEAWIEVIRKMDEVYADLVRHQLELEEKNSALEEAQQFIRSVLASMTDVLIVCDERGHIVQVDNALLTLVGRDEAQIIGIPLSSLFAAESKTTVERFRRRIHREIIADCETYLLGENGESIPLAMNCSPRYDHNGRLLGMVLLGRPISELRQAYDALNQTHHELKRTQSQLVQSEKMASLGRLVAGVAHELNNPISFVFGNMHALQRYGQRITHYLSAIDQGITGQALDALREELKIDRIVKDLSSLIDGTLEGAERVSSIVQDLRRYSGSQREPARSFDLVQLIRTAVLWVLKAARISPEVVYQLPDALEICSRKGLLQQIMVNLVQNAVDVMEGMAEPKLMITCRGEEEKIVVSIRDYGPGIEKGALSKVFDPFYTTKEVGKGTGLGLSISYSLARDVGGDLIAANHPGGGAVFSLILPKDIHE